MSDINDLGDAAPNEEIVYCDLSKEDDVYKLVKDCDGIVHFGGISIEKSWSLIRPANVRACTVYMKQQEKQARIICQLDHAVGFFKQTDYLDDKALPRPDGLYGVSKVFGENCASLYLINLRWQNIADRFLFSE